MIRIGLALLFVSLLCSTSLAGVTMFAGSSETGNDFVFSGSIELPVLRAPNYMDALNNVFLSLIAGVDSREFVWGGVGLTLLAYPISNDPDWPCGASFSFGSGCTWSEKTSRRNGSPWMFRVTAEIVFCGLVLGWAHWSNAGLEVRNDAIDIFYVGWRFNFLDFE